MDFLKKMMSYKNTHESTDTYCKIIDYTLLHANDLPTISITKMSADIFVSPPTITRFIKTFFNTDFLTFKYEIQRMNDASTSFNLQPKFDIASAQRPEEYLQNIQIRLNSVLDKLSANSELATLTQIACLIKQSKHVAIIGIRESLEIALNLQLGFLMRKQSVDVPENTTVLSEITKNYTENDVIIIISNNGNYFSSNRDDWYQIRNAKAKLVLISQDYSGKFSPIFDYIFKIGFDDKRIGTLPTIIVSDYLLTCFDTHE